MKKLLSLVFAFVFVFSFSSVSADNITANEFDELYSVVYYADYFYNGLNVDYIVNRSYKDLFLKYQTNDNSRSVELSKDIVEAYLNENFEMNDAIFGELKTIWSYNATTETYNIPFAGGKGGTKPERHFLGCYKTDDGKYQFYFQHTTYQKITAEVAKKYLGKPEEMLYSDAQHFESSHYYRVISLDDYGLVHTVELNEGVVRFISTEEYSKEDIPSAFNVFPTKSITDYSGMMPEGFTTKTPDESSIVSSEESSETISETSSSNPMDNSSKIDVETKPGTDYISIAIIGLMVVAIGSILAVIIIMLKKKVNKD